ncbi:hypothetical protein D1872_214540 [compost metagenome]
MRSRLRDHILNFFRIVEAHHLKSGNSHPVIQHFHIQILTDTSCYFICIGLQIEHILAFPANPFHQQLIQHGGNANFNILYKITVFHTGNFINQCNVIIHFKVKRTVCSNRHAARKLWSRDHDRILGPPFNSKFLRIHEKNLYPHATVEAKFESFQRRQERDDIRIDAVFPIILKNPFNFAIVHENSILTRADNQFTAFLDLPVAPFPENHILSKLFPFHHI